MLDVVDSINSNVLQDVKSKLDSLASSVSRTALTAVGKNHEEVLKWLTPVDQSEIFAASLRSHEPGTGDWLLRGETYKNWRETPHSTLWLHGDGK